jgi:hypothetical protein
MIIAALVATPAFAPVLEHDPATLAANEVAERLTLLRRDARVAGTAATFAFDPATSHYWELLATSAGFALRDEGTLTSSGVRWIHPTTRRAYVRFAPTGAATGDSIVVAAGTARAVVRFDPLTGEVEVVSE